MHEQAVWPIRAEGAGTMSESVHKTFGHAICERIVEQRFGGNQSEFARDLGLSAAAVNRWFKSWRKPGRETAEQLKKRYGVPTESWDQPASTDGLRRWDERNGRHG